MTPLMPSRVLNDSHSDNDDDDDDDDDSSSPTELLKFVQI